jgi:broad specificity phosphatase PhoE
MARIIFVRHGESMGNVWPEAYKDEQRNFLTPYGAQQAALCGSYFKRMNYEFDHVICSTKTRALHTTAIILHQMDDWQRQWDIRPELDELHTSQGESPERVMLELPKLLSILRKDQNMLVVSHYHTMQALFDAAQVPRKNIGSHEGRHVGNAVPFLWNLEQPEMIHVLDFTKLGPQH